MTRPAAVYGKKSPVDIEVTDLRGVSRRADRCLTTVFLEWDWENKHVKWLVLGEARLIPQRDRNDDGRWRLEAYLPVGVTDFEHDSAYLLKLPLIGVEFDSVNYHVTRIRAWVDPNAVDEFSQDFRVPGPGYDPMRHPKAETCDGVYDEKKRKYCKRGDNKPHVIVPEGFWVPPFDPKLYEKVRGKKVEIQFSTVDPEDGA